MKKPPPRVGDPTWHSASDLTVESYATTSVGKLAFNGTATTAAAAASNANKKRSTSSTFLARANLLTRSATLIKEYASLALRTDTNRGAPDAYFKKTLRQYDDLTFYTPPSTRSTSRRPKSENRKEKVKKRTVLQQEHEPQQQQQQQRRPFVSASDSVLVTPRAQRHQKDIAVEDPDVFYSPASYPDDCYAHGEPLVEQPVEFVVARRGKDHQDLDVRSFGESPRPKSLIMADTEAEGEAGEGEDPVEETEKLVDDTKAEMDKISGQLDNDEVPTDEKAVLKEVEECEAQCMEIYKILSELKQRVSELLNKASRTPQEDQELEAKQKLLNDKMALLEQKTRRIELLVGKTKKPDFDKFYDEDTLPKVVVCGLAENNMPKFIICDDKKRKTNKKQACSPLTGPSKRCPNASMPQQPFQVPCGGGGGGGGGGFPQTCPMPCMPPIATSNQVMMSTVPQIARRLSESYEMQERLAQENADLEGKRYQLQEDLLSREQNLDCLQRQLQCMQQELRQVVRENANLNCKLQQIQVKDGGGRSGPSSAAGCCPPCQPRSPGGDKPCPPKPCGPGKGPCPADDETRRLEKQLTLMEMEVKAIQNELTTVRQERLHLEQHRRMLSPMTCPPPCGGPCMPPCPPRNDAQLREMREKYNCLQDDYKSKLTEVAGLRADVDKMKSNLQEANEARKSLEEKIKELTKMLNELRDPKSGSFTKENFIELEQQLLVAKQRFREAQDELDELRALTEEQQNQLTDYRNKYLEAQQQVEEQKRQMDLMELENSRIGEQVNLEIQRVKNQFQEKLQELTPLPDILKATQLKLQEAQQMHLMAERNNEALLREIQNLRDKAVMAVEQMEANKSGIGNLDAERQNLQEANEELDRQLQLMNTENEDLRHEMERMHDEVEDAEKRAQEKLHEIAQLSAEVENVRDEAARQVARVKDRCETVRRSMQNTVCDLEKQLAQSRAQAKSAQRDRDDIRQKMQSQINNLNENFEDAQMRIRALQGHVNFLKTSAAVYPSLDQMTPSRNCN